MTIGLPENPKDKQYEDCVAATLSALGYFTECNVRLKHESTEVFELDAVATPSDSRFTSPILFEAKSGKTGFSDMFKVYGQRMYLNIDEGCVVASKEADADKIPALAHLTNATNVRRYHFDVSEFQEIENLASPCIQLEDSLRLKVIATKWYEQIAVRLCQASFIKWCKSNKSIGLASEMRKYAEEIEKSFFARTPLERANILYSAYFSTEGGLTRKIVTFLSSSKQTQEKQIWNSLRDSPDHPWAQYVMFLEHRARTYIIKNAVLHRLNNPQQTFGEFLMPKGFHKTLTSLIKHPYVHSIPYLFQVFIELFGGFYVDDQRDRALLAEVSGIPEADVIDCLQLYDSFFPMKGWFHKAEGLTLMKLVPAFIRGIGCFFRTASFHLKTYEELSSWYSLHNWHNASYQILEPELKKEP